MNDRRTFLKIAIAGIVAFFVFVWNKLTLNHIEATQQNTSVVPLNKNKEVTFADRFIIVNQNNSTTVFSAHCTHLGCKIDKYEGDRLVCPCHGSEYNLQGEVMKGPAYKNLNVIPSQISDDGKNIIIGA
ncbi:Rieske (2Fe-2S) protein [Maribellus sp. YY47]|uniref:QcrA and Rieske domain-containing protein n=1 Tax=Maribellus sp. YY47 TaxID=2929486 RepID=UPI0020016C0C|nr:Rieske (2Fe-2S) protein [Maribellus sp. YY47]MCK3682560.1 Rieske (2Fe-2S) protein [Maribellus sp. YY47]